MLLVTQSHALGPICAPFHKAVCVDFYNYSFYYYLIVRNRASQLFSQKMQLLLFTRLGFRRILTSGNEHTQGDIKLARNSAN